MDTVPTREFMGIFNRVTNIVDLKGAYTPEEVRARLERDLPDDGRKQTLMERGFPERVIEEFRKFRTDSLITLTLLFGKRKAYEIKKLLLRRRFEKLRRTAEARELMKKELQRERSLIERGFRELRLRERIFQVRRRLRRWK